MFKGVTVTDLLYKSNVSHSVCIFHCMSIETYIAHPHSFHLLKAWNISSKIG